ncbi:hypothetical protein EDM54_02150 [Brevibacillus borstelensis]|uniref:hypothetical protein n=1 Tax=Brevibacillus borstelensis TaxID=45462 RepID=UPI000F0752D5|nr:hypothetical protein [Brevibacillus borstelensis]MED1885559.1 hypothetical protein [Brevibacillus borstelensis]RNB66197.1 hypothetical protein EDM54_02150 [Brevibacillus borstelensis]GED55185.1 hypothetical protein BBO01nite_44260 [Brevibacillus borstelensis]
MNEAWYESKLFVGAVGWLVSLITFYLGYVINKSNQEKNDRRNIIILITQTNSSLFSLIYQYSLNPASIDYVKLRTELLKTNVIYVLPPKIKLLFQDLYTIHLSGPDYYTQNKHLIPGKLQGIVNELNEYGVDTFGYK